MASREMSEAEFVSFLNNTLRLIAGEQSTCIPTDSVGYCTVAYTPMGEARTAWTHRVIC